ncbi:MAG: hypothetical protein LBK60_07285 [Verrucomicrobiales bacterium]|jgi:hypothetical protein|nr:hypothetical protein [Verrucomicrobiales bacterium]
MKTPRPIFPLLLILGALTVTAQEPDPAAGVDREPPAPAAVDTPPAPKPKPAPKSIPRAWGDRTGPVYIGHRFVTERYTEWGWVWKEKQDYRKGRWVIVQETPGRCPIPSRLGNDLKSDHDYEYRLYGEFLPEQGYDPNYDLYVEVFRLKGFELIGPADPLPLTPAANSASPTKRRSSSLPTRGHRVELDY